MGGLNPSVFSISGGNFHPRYKKSSNDFLQSLPLKFSVSYRNRTYNRALGEPRYIHLTKETNAVFPGFFALLAPAAIIYRWPFSYGKTWLPSEAMFNLTIFLQNAQVPEAKLFRGSADPQPVLPPDPAD